MQWKKVYSKGEVIGRGTHYEREQVEDEWRLDHQYARGAHGYSGGSRVRIGRSYNGGGVDAFGGAREWPRVCVEVSLPEDAEKLAEALALRLRAVVAAFIAAHDLERTDV